MAERSSKWWFVAVAGIAGGIAAAIIIGAIVVAWS
jgi:hypothetical protein